MNNTYDIVVKVSFFLFGISIVSCNNASVLSGDDYLKFIQEPENGFFLEKRVDDIEFKLQYTTTEYMLINELRKTEIHKEVLDNKKRENEGLLFFKFKISSTQGGDILSFRSNSQEETYERINYMSYGMEQDLVLVNDKDTIYPSLFNFARTYGVVPYADFIFAFDSKIGEHDILILFDDKIFNSGLLKFKIDKEDLKNLPKLRTI